MKHLTFVALALAGVPNLGLRPELFHHGGGHTCCRRGSNTYRFYVNMQDATDRMSAVFGNDQASMIVNTPEGAFNSTFNSSWNASGINPIFLPTFPELADDTYATIGLTGPASTSGIVGAADPSIVEDANQLITPLFPDARCHELGEHDADRCFLVRIEHGRQRSATDENLQVLMMQVTTTGDDFWPNQRSGVPLGVGADQYQGKHSVSWSGHVFDHGG